MENLVAVIVSISLTLLLSVGYFVHQSDNLAEQNRIQLAMQEAELLVTFNQALDGYVKTNVSNPAAFSNQPISAATLGLSSTQGVDVLGETLGGYVASPYNAPQSWFTAPVAAGADQNGVSTTAIMAKFGLNDPVSIQAWWGKVAQDVAQLTNGNAQGYVYNSIDATLTAPNNAQVTMVAPGQSSPTSGSAAWDQLVNYAPTSGVPNPGVAPVIYAPQQFSEIVSDTLSQLTGYWVWYLQIANQWGTGCPSSGATCTVQESFFSLGWAPSCPVGGITPIAFSSTPTLISNVNDPAIGSLLLSTPVCIPIPKTTYQAIVGNGFNFSAACQSSGQGCTAYNINGVQSGYSASCSGSNCQSQDTQNGRGYNPANNGQDGEGDSQSNWVNYSFNQAADYLYGSYLLKLPGGQTYSLLWVSGFNFYLPGWWYFNGAACLYTNNVVGQPVYTAFTSPGYTRNSWPFSVVNDSANPSDTSNNQNYTVITF